MIRMDTSQPRLFTGVECLGPQGLPVETLLAGSDYGFSDRFHMCLAGNAFSAGTYAAAALAALVSILMP